MRAILKTSSRHGGGGAAVARPDRQLAHAYHVRGHAPERRTRQQCLAADCASERELPHRARPLAGGDPAGTGKSRGRSQNFCKRYGRNRTARPTASAYAQPPLRPDVFQPLEKVVESMWPGLPVLPAMATGASDGVYTNAAGMPTYCVSGEAIDRDDMRSHGKDERIQVDSFYRAVDFYYRYLKAVTSQ